MTRQNRRKFLKNLSATIGSLFLFCNKSLAAKKSKGSETSVELSASAARPNASRRIIALLKMAALVMLVVVYQNECRIASNIPPPFIA